MFKFNKAHKINEMCYLFSVTFILLLSFGLPASPNNLAIDT